MTIQEQIKEDLKESMKAKNAVKTGVLKGFISEFTNESVKLGRTPQDPLSNEESLGVIKRLSKQRKDSIEQFEKGGRPELAESEKAELLVIEEYLPEMMSEEEVRAHVLKKKDELGIESPEQFGQLMGAVMADLKDKADGSVVKKVIDESLQG
ncbi:GatB/YqeY domain-containing protein [Candidatus Parcubacteria bacterium]|nr:GatB/YqeY domain-containing protein [Candidatus Parcubacteria bacterium]